MNAHRCCVANSAGSGEAGMRIPREDPRPPSFTQRTIRFAGKMTPLALLAILPKCPLCLVAYVALATGIGISLTAATYLRFLLIVACVSALTYFIVKAVRRKRSCAGHPAAP
jgi:hypothetical protein